MWLFFIMKTHVDYHTMIEPNSLFQAWKEFRLGKGKRLDVQEFERYLEDNLFDLHKSLEKKTYRHGGYHAFYVQDPKRRHIHKAQVKDRIVHHLLYQYLYSLFDKTFIYDSYSCRVEKGTHKGVERLAQFSRIVSRNYSSTCWALKCDIRKFFASVDHQILLTLLKDKKEDSDILWLLSQIIDSFQSDRGKGSGIPLGNLTSQVFANIYMNELDQFVKHTLKIKYYIRYADDFVLLSNNKDDLLKLIDP
ncbi:MAG: reverse transcriptase domain-containing protein, partial [Actinomycetes bacterium]